MSARSTPSPTTWPRMTTARTTRRGTATRSATAPRPTRRSGGAGTTRPATTTCGHGVRGRQLQAVVREAARSPPEAAFNTQLSSFERALALTNPPAEPLDVKLDNHRLSAFFLRAHGSGRHRRPTIILVNGYDASISDMYLAMGQPGAGPRVPRRARRRPGAGKAARPGRHDADPGLGAGRPGCGRRHRQARRRRGTRSASA